MKKIYKMSGWNADVFTEDNVLNRTHWMVKALYEMITLLDIGDFSISYKDASSVTLASVNYGLFEFDHPSLANSTPFIFYVDSDNKEMFACCSADAVVDYTTGTITTSKSGTMNGLRGRFPMFSSTNVLCSCSGGYHGIKFTDGKIIGCSDKYAGMYAEKGILDTFDITGCVLGFRKEVLAAPVDSVEIRYTRLPIYEKFMTFPFVSSSSSVATQGNDFNGLFFRNINTTDKMYLGALKSSDNIKIFYGGYLFIVDDANDIGLITV